MCIYKYFLESVMQYPSRESKSLEFKEKIPSKLTSIIRTCVAFANTSGGELVIGVEDKTRVITGIKDNDIERCFEQLPNAIFDGIKPSLIPEVYEQNLDGKTIIIIKISKGHQKPYYVTNEGLPKGIYIRIGPHTRRINEDYLEELKRDQRRLAFDRESSTATKEDLDTDLIKQAYGPNFTTALLVRDGVLANSAHKKVLVSNGGVLMFASQPDKFIPGATLMCTRFRGENGRNVIESHEFAGPIPQVIETTFQQLVTWLERHHRLIGAQLKGKTIIPSEAIREALTNAVIHRKYSIPGPIKVALYDNRLEIFNPGDFPGLIDVNNLGDGSTYLRNSLIAKFARKLRLIEKLGSGVPLIFSSCINRGLKKPQYFSTGDFVKLVFYFEKELRKGVNIKHTIMEMLDEYGQLKTKDVLSKVSVSRNTVTNAFNTLIREKKIQRIGEGRGVVYEKA